MAKMKSTLLYLLVFTYTASICKPLMPYIADTIAHHFYYVEHIKKVHTENGKQHVHYELLKQNKNTEGNDTQDSFKKISLANEHLLTDTFSQLLHSSIADKYFRFIKAIVFGGYLEKDFPPPRC